MRDKNMEYKRGDLKKIIASLKKKRFTGSVRFNKGEALFSEGNPVFFIYDHELKKEDVERFNEQSKTPYKIEKLDEEELQLRIKWHKLIDNIEEKSREEVMEDLGIQEVEKKYIVKILESEDLLYLLEERGIDASTEE